MCAPLGCKFAEGRLLMTSQVSIDYNDFMQYFTRLSCIMYEELNNAVASDVFLSEYSSIHVSFIAERGG